MIGYPRFSRGHCINILPPMRVPYPYKRDIFSETRRKKNQWCWELQHIKQPPKLLPCSQPPYLVINLPSTIDWLSVSFRTILLWERFKIHVYNSVSFLYIGIHFYNFVSIFCICTHFYFCFHFYNSESIFLFSLYNHGLILFTNPSARAGYDTRSIFKRSLTGLYSEFPFS